MNTFRKAPYCFLWIAAVLLLLLSFTDSNVALDINLHDSYFVIAYVQLYLTGALLLFIMWGIYILASGTLLSNKLTWVHIIVTVTIMLTLAIRFFLQTGVMSGIPRRYYSFNAIGEGPQLAHTLQLYLQLFSMLTLVQVCFVVNILGGILKKFSA